MTDEQMIARRETMEINDLIDLLKQQYAEMLPQWYCDLNCYRRPVGFPIELGYVGPEYHENQTFKMAYDAVLVVLGEAGASLAWWCFELGKTEAEWAEFWFSRGDIRQAASRFHPSIDSHKRGSA